MAKADAIAEAHEPRLNERVTRWYIVAGVVLASFGILYFVAPMAAGWLWTLWAGGYWYRHKIA